MRDYITMKKEFHAFFMGRTKKLSRLCSYFHSEKEYKKYVTTLFTWKKLTQYGAQEGSVLDDV